MKVTFAPPEPRGAGRLVRVVSDSSASSGPSGAVLEAVALFEPSAPVSAGFLGARACGNTAATETRQEIVPSGGSDHAIEPTMAASSAEIPSGAADSQEQPNKDEEEILQQKRKCFKLIIVLVKYLKTRNPKMHWQAKLIMKDCKLRHERGEPGFESVTMAMTEKLRRLVGDAYWQRAGEHLECFLEEQQRQRQMPAPQKLLSLAVN